MREWRASLPAEKKAHYRRNAKPKPREVARVHEAAYRERNRDRYNESKRAWEVRNPDKAAASHAKAGAAYRERNADALRARNREAARTPEAKAARATRHAANPGARRDYAFRRLYGITLVQWTAILDAQGGCCALCRRALAGLSAKSVHTDHDHATGRVRGILCNGCNFAMGRVERAGIARVIGYLHSPAHPALVGPEGAVDYSPDIRQ